MGKNVKTPKPEKVNSLKKISAVSKGIGKKANATQNVKPNKKPAAPIQNGKPKKTKQETKKPAAEKTEKVISNKQAKSKPQGPVANKGKAKPKQDKVKPKPDQAEQEHVQVLKLTKRTKNRVKAEIKKEIILKGKSTAILSTPNVVRKKLAKLEAKPEPRSVKAQKKILLLKSMLERLEKENKAPEKGQDVSVVTNGVKKAKTKNATESQFPKNEFVVFIGRLNPSITLEMVTLFFCNFLLILFMLLMLILFQLREHFKPAGEVQRATMPEPKKRKSRRFAYIQFDSEESRQVFLQTF